MARRKALPDQGSLLGIPLHAPVTDTGVIYRDDNLAVLRDLPTESVDLVYLDPPFFSNRFYEVIWGDEAEVRSFEDRWEGGMQHYIGWMQERISELHRVLKPTGSLYLHCDPHASHYLKVMCDEIFGMARFRNEVVWKRTSAHSSAKRWGPIHDIVLFYSKSDQYTWNRLFQPYDPYYLSQFYTHVDEAGRRWRRSDLTGSGIRHGETGKPWRGRDVTAKGRHWMVPPDELDKLDAAGKIHWPAKHNGMPMLKRYADEQPGVPLQDVISDIPPMHNLSKERLGYPTQKPEALLQRILESSSNENDIVLDPFCGCGTTIAVADRLKRQWIGIDISPTAVEIMRRRLLKQHTSPRILNPVDSVTELKKLKPFEFQNWIVNAVFGTHSPRPVKDMGIDGYWFLTKDPIQVKQSEHVGRNVVDNFETAMRRAGHTVGYVIGFSFTKDAAEEVARAKKVEGLDIQLIKVAQLLIEMKRPHGKFGPQPASVDELPLPRMRKSGDMPTADELVESDQQTGTE